jgi:hypothetical protein
MESLQQLPLDNHQFIFDPFVATLAILLSAIALKFELGSDRFVWIFGSERFLD